MFVIISILSILCVATVASIGVKNYNLATGFSILSFIYSAFFVVTVPPAFGYGHVPPVAEAFIKRLENGATYKLVSSEMDGADQILLVKKAGTPNFYALRVKEIPPEHFTLIGGEPVAIVAPAPPVVAK